MNESNIFGVSVRAILAFIIVTSCCLLAFLMKDMPVLKELALIATGYLFGKSTSTNGGEANGTKINVSGGDPINGSTSTGGDSKPK